MRVVQPTLTAGDLVSALDLSAVPELRVSYGACVTTNTEYPRVHRIHNPAQAAPVGLLRPDREGCTCKRSGGTTRFSSKKGQFQMECIV